MSVNAAAPPIMRDDGQGSSPAAVPPISLVTPASTDTPSLASPATSVAATRGSTPASSPGLSASDVSTTSARSDKTTTSKKPPTLSDIAARMKLDGKDKDDADKSGSSQHLDVNAPLRGRLGLAGRLNSSSSDTSASAHTTVTATSDNEAETNGGVKLSPQALAVGLPPTSSDAASASTSPSMPSTQASAQPHTIDSAATQKSKGIPSLDDIRERMAKKGHASPSKGVAAWDEPFEKKPSLWDRADPNAGKSSSGAMMGGGGAASAFASSSPTKSPTRSPKMKASPMLGNKSSPVLGTTAIKASPVLGTKSMMLPPTSTAPLSHKSSAAAAAGPSKPSRQPIPPGHHPLQHKWTVFYDSKSPTAAPPAGSSSATEHGWDVYDPRGLAGGPSASGPRSAGASGSGGGGADSWEAALKVVGAGAYHTVESFMEVFKGLRRPSVLDLHSNYHLFKDGIKPMWEDPANSNGGKWTISFSRSTVNPALLDRSWMWLSLALIGEELDGDDEITGAVVSSRPKANRISLWLRDRSDVERVNRMGRKLVDLLEVEREPGVSVEFSAVNAATSGFAHSHHRNRDAAATGYWSLNTGRGAGGGGDGAAAGTTGAGGASRPPARSSFSSSSGSGLGIGGPIGRTGGGIGQGAGLLGRTGHGGGGGGKR